MSTSAAIPLALAQTGRGTPVVLPIEVVPGTGDVVPPLLAEALYVCGRPQYPTVQHQMLGRVATERRGLHHHAKLVGNRDIETRCVDRRAPGVGEATRPGMTAFA